MKNHRNLILFALLLLGISVYAQQNLRSYYKYVTVAENFIMLEQYDSAVIYYENAFKNKDFPFGSDLENAAFCESKLPQPSLERCKYYIENGISKWYLKKRLGMDTTLMSNIILNYSSIQEVQEVYDTVIKMIERDQFVRTVEYNTMPNVDSTNIAIYKEMLKTFDLLDLRIIGSGLGDLGTLFIHWLDYTDFRAFITPIMLKAVQDGRYDARLFAEQMDYAIFRDNDFNGSFLQYGTYLLKIFILGEEDSSKPYGERMKERKYFAYFDFDKNNPDDMEKIKEIDENRAEIYLGGIIESRIREFTLYVFRSEKDDIPYKLDVPALFIDGREKDLSILRKEIDKNPYLIYYIQGKNDFNIK
jgi:hypothetical protein